MAFESLSEFVLKSPVQMVFPLLFDVASHGVDLRGAYRESAVSSLPTEIGKLGSLILDPARGRLLHYFDDFREREGPGESEQNMDMVFYGIENDGRTVEVLEDGRHIGVKVRSDRLVKQRPPILGAEDKVDMDAGVGLWHRF